MVLSDVPYQMLWLSDVPYEMGELSDLALRQRNIIGRSYEMDRLSDYSTLSDGPIRNRAAKLLSDLESGSGQRNITGRSCPTWARVIGPCFSRIGPNNENRWGDRIFQDIIGMMLRRYDSVAKTPQHSRTFQ